MVFYFTPLRIIQRDEQWTHPIGHALSSVKKKRRANINSRVCRTFLLTTEEEKKIGWSSLAGLQLVSSTQLVNAIFNWSFHSNAHYRIVPIALNTPEAIEERETEW